MPLAFSAARTPGRCDWNFESKSCSAGKTSNSAPRFSSFQIRTLSSMKSMMPMKVSSLPRGDWMGGELGGGGVGGEPRAHGADAVVEVGAHAVHLVDEGDAGDVVAVGLPPDGFRPRLGAGGRGG